MQIANTRSDTAMRVASSLIVTPIVVQPVLVIASCLWALHESIVIHPDRAAVNPPTVSRAIADPVIGDAFANLMLVGFVLLLFSVWRIGIALYRPTLSLGAKALWLLIMASAVMAAVGMVVLSQYTGSISDYLHTVGSYMLFFGHGIEIATVGIFVLLDRNVRIIQAETGAPLPYGPRLHPRFAVFVAVISLFYCLQYFDFDDFGRWSDYGARLVFASTEMVVLTSFETFLASFALPIYRHEYYMMRRLPLAQSLAVQNG
jgi:hypothetical protein